MNRRSFLASILAAGVAGKLAREQLQLDLS